MVCKVVDLSLRGEKRCLRILSFSRGSGACALTGKSAVTSSGLKDLEGETRESVRMLNTPQGESSNSRSPRDGRARGSSVPVRTSRSRRVDRFEENLPGFPSTARSNGPSEYGPVLRGRNRNPVRSPQAVHAPPTLSFWTSGCPSSWESVSTFAYSA